MGLFSPRLLFWVLVFLAPISAGILRVWVHQDIVRLGYQLSDLEKQRRVVRQQLQQYEIELAAEESPENLARVARKLGLRPPSPQQLLQLSRSERRP
jgi:hypothetical protein